VGGTFFVAVLATPAMATVAQGTHAHIAVRKWVRTQSLFVRYKALLIYVSKWLWPTLPMNCETRYVNDLSKMRNCFNRMTKFRLQASRKSSIELLMRMAFLPLEQLEPVLQKSGQSLDVQDLIDIAESQGLLVRLDTNRWQVLE